MNMQPRFRFIIVVICAIVIGTVAVTYAVNIKFISPLPPPSNREVPSIELNNVFVYSFNENGTLYETNKMHQSTSPYWWLDSGAMLNIFSDIGSTNVGELPAGNYWRLLYAKNNPTDTDNGYHPQNIFRLVSRTTWHNVRQQMYFLIDADQMSDSPNRNESNGILLFSRYRDSDNLYYAGIRVDGFAVIKKKVNGTYYTIATRRIFGDSGTQYVRDAKISYLPKRTWIGLKMETVTQSDGKVRMTLYTDIGKTNIWSLAVEAIDDGFSYGGQVINDTSSVGVRTDFMDVAFAQYRAEELKGVGM